MHTCGKFIIISYSCNMYVILFVDQDVASQKHVSRNAGINLIYSVQMEFGSR